MKLVCTMVAAFAASTFALVGEREEKESYFAQRCLPVARAFFRTNQSIYDPDFATNRITHWKVNLSDDSVVYTSQFALEKGALVFMFQGTQRTNMLQFFGDYRVWRENWLNGSHMKELRQLATQTNCLDQRTALALATKCFHGQGHRDSDFHPPKIERVMWAEGSPTARIILPLYKVEWIRRDVKLPDDEKTLYPHLRITVSGTNSNVVEYASLIPLKR